MNNIFVYPQDVDTFVFDWGRLALTIAPQVNDAQNFSAGLVDLPPGQAMIATIIPVPRKLSLSFPVLADKWSKMKLALQFIGKWARIAPFTYPKAVITQRSIPVANR